MRPINLLLLAFVCSIMMSTPALACDTTIILAQADNMTLDQAINKVKGEKKGKILDAKTRQINGQVVHEIKVLTSQGHVKKIQIQTE